MHLSVTDQEILSGTHGPAIRVAMELLVASGDASGARSFIDISGAHIDGCLYHGQAGLDFATRLVELSGQVKVPTTLNVSSLDLLHPDLYRGSGEMAAKARCLMDAYEKLGCVPSWTCAPYQLAERPGFGDQIAWGESNAIVFANSVLGARTNRYGDFLDICCALTGRAPYVGLHTDEGRRATLHVVLHVADDMLDHDLLYPVLGHALGSVAGTRVAVITGLDERATEDRLKALGAAAASSGAVGLFHAVGVTPEAPSLEEACGWIEPYQSVVIDRVRLREAHAQLSRSGGPLAAVSVGTPHSSLAEIAQLAKITSGKRSQVPFYINTSRDTLSQAEEADLTESIEEFGATFVTDTCTYITPIMGDLEGTVMTNSGKWAYYAPGNLGIAVVLAGLSDCVDSAVQQTVKAGVPW